jgi:hypothetical protein
VKRLLAAAAGILGIAWLGRRRAATAPAPAADPAADLRAKLAEAREESEADEKPVDEAPDVADRRRAVHDRARAAIDELQQRD